MARSRVSQVKQRAPTLEEYRDVCRAVGWFGFDVHTGMTGMFQTTPLRNAAGPSGAR